MNTGALCRSTTVVHRVVPSYGISSAAKLQVCEVFATGRTELNFAVAQMTVDALSAECCLVLLIEDVHWLDRMSWDVVSALVDWTKRTPGTWRNASFE